MRLNSLDLIVPKKTGRAHVSLSLGGIGIWGTFTSPWESMDFTVDHHTLLRVGGCKHDIQFIRSNFRIILKLEF